MSVKYKVSITIKGLPEDEDEYDEKVEEAKSLLEDNGFDIDVGIGEPDE